MMGYVPQVGKRKHRELLSETETAVSVAAHKLRELDAQVLALARRPALSAGELAQRVIELTTLRGEVARELAAAQRALGEMRDGLDWNGS